ncbi:MAG: sialidase family protein, partial [Clostridia bacterium]
MRTHLVWDKAPQPGNGRNSEGAFLKAHNGNILYAYNRYSSDQWGDDASCDIAMIRSCDEGETWGEPEIIVHAADFQVENIMSPTGLEQNNGDLAFYFHIKEHNGTNTFGRAISKDDGFTFASSRCICDFIQEYYVSNNDRAIRLSDGSIVIPVAMHSTSGNFADFQKHYMDSNAVSMCLVSLDDGASFTRAPARVMLPVSYNDSGMQEPGLIEKKNGVLWLYARTTCGYQYQCFSFDGMRTFTPSVPSLFTSPCSPLKISRGPDDAL